MAAYTGVGTRIRERMVKLGYVRADGEPDVQRFSWDFRYDRTLIYAWLAGKATPFKDLIRLAQDLQISVEWLLTGQERVPVGSGLLHTAPLPVDPVPLKRKQPTKSKGERGRGATLRKVPGQTAARYMHYPAQTAGLGTRRRVA